MAVEGGNWQIFSNMLNASGAALKLETRVERIETQDTDGHRDPASYTYRVHSTKTQDSNPQSSAHADFHAIILAAPFHQSNITFSPNPPAHVPDDIEYVTLHVTLFSSAQRLSPVAFALRPDERVPDIVLTTLPPEEQDALEDSRHDGVGAAGFFSVSRLRSAVNPYADPPRTEHIYKIFSPAPVDDSFFKHILGGADVSWIRRKVWKSYPYLPPRVTFEPQLLQPGLWYTSGIESFISTMETGSLAGKNVAKLVVESLTSI